MIDHVTWTAEALVTAWQDVFLGIEAHIKDRMAMSDPASPETYLSIIAADVADVKRRSQQIIAARWADNQRYQDRIKALETPPEDPAALVRIAEKAAAEWLMSDDTAYELSPEDAYRVAREMLRVANEAYKGVRLIGVAYEGQA